MRAQEIRDLIKYLQSLLPHKKPAPHPGPEPIRFGIDYAYGLPSHRALRSAGVSFVCRYLSSIGNSKNLSAREVKYYRRLGIPIVTVWETTATRALQGYAAGVQDGLAAGRMLMNLGAPRNAVVFFAIDFDDQAAPVGPYFHGCATALGIHRVGAYGGYEPIKRLLSGGFITWAWQTYAWSGGAWDHRARLRQFSNGHKIGGVDCDFNRAIGASFGQWS